MRKLESIQEFYQTRHNWLPEDIKNNLGHFNVFELQYPYIGKGAEDLEYGRREWYNIVFVEGGGIFQCSGKEYQVENNAVAFSTPFTPFGWLDRNKISKGYYCIFNLQFLKKDKRIVELPLFKTNSIPFYELSKQEAKDIELLFKRMFNELKSDYQYKYDMCMLLMEEIIHITMKSESYKTVNEHLKHSASERITIHFFELLERQFPIEDVNHSINLLSASDFANQLNIHVNHLNKSVKETTEKTTTSIIKERIAQEAQTLLLMTDWNISEISYCLGFKEPTHFNNFFKKFTKLSPSQFRNI